MARIPLCLCLILTALHPTANSATFENLTLILTTRHDNNFVSSTPAEKKIFVIKSDNILSLLDEPLLEVVLIQHQKVPKLPRGSLSDLPNVEMLEITSSGVEEIEPGALRNVPKLETANFGDNAIEEVKSGVFGGLPIKYLILQNNRISRIESGAFSNMSLWRLELDRNFLTSWDSTWFRGSAVNAISMGWNLLKELPRRCLPNDHNSSAVDFWFLILNDNRLRKIERGAFEGWDSIGYLNLKNNRLKHLQVGVFEGVDRINNLDLANNSISEIDANVFRGMEVSFLKLQDNLLRCLPVAILNATELRSVSVSGNPFDCGCVETWWGLGVVDVAPFRARCTEASDEADIESYFL